MRVCGFYGSLAGLSRLVIETRGELADYNLTHSAWAGLCRRLGWKDEARLAYQSVLSLTRREYERYFLKNRLRELD